MDKNSHADNIADIKYMPATLKLYLETFIFPPMLGQRLNITRLIFFDIIIIK